MEYSKNQAAVADVDDDEEEMDHIPSSSSSAPVTYNPPSIRGSAFSKPILPPSSSLISSPRGAVAATSATAAAAAKNVSLFGAATQPPSLHQAQAAAFNSSDPPAAFTSSDPAADAPKNSPNVSVRYRECLRNHAAASGGHILDGCGEFMPESGGDALKCAACGCHRSFHRKDADGNSDVAAAVAADSYYHSAGPRIPLLLPPPPPPHHHASHHHHHQKSPPFQFGSPSTPSSGVVAFGSASGGTTTESSSEERGNAAAPAHATVHRKRFRTKFTAEQKEKMLAFAEQVGWKFQRQDEALMEKFCSEAGVRRQVFKVWMHNNKHLIKKQQQQPPPPPPLHLDGEPLSQQHHQHQPHSSQHEQQL